MCPHFSHHLDAKPTETHVDSVQDALDTNKESFSITGRDELSYALPDGGSYTISTMRDRARTTYATYITYDPDKMELLPSVESVSLVFCIKKHVEKYLLHLEDLAANGYTTSMRTQKEATAKELLRQLKMLEGRERSLKAGEAKSYNLLRNEIITLVCNSLLTNELMTLSAHVNSGLLNDILTEAQALALRIETHPGNGNDTEIAERVKTKEIPANLMHSGQITRLDQGNYRPATNDEFIENSILADIFAPLLPPETAINLRKEAIRRINDFFCAEADYKGLDTTFNPFKDIASLLDPGAKMRVDDRQQAKALKSLLVSINDQAIVHSDDSITPDHLIDRVKHNSAHRDKVIDALKAYRRQEATIKAEHERLQAVAKIKNTYLRAILVKQPQITTDELQALIEFFQRAEVSFDDTNELEEILTALNIAGLSTDELIAGAKAAHLNRPPLVYTNTTHVAGTPENLGRIAVAVAKNYLLASNKFKAGEEINWNRGRRITRFIANLADRLGNAIGGKSQQRLHRFRDFILPPRATNHGVTNAGASQSTVTVGYTPDSHAFNSTSTDGSFAQFPSRDDLYAISTIYEKRTLWEKIKISCSKFAVNFKQFGQYLKHELFTEAVWKARFKESEAEFNRGHIISKRVRKAIKLYNESNAASKITYTPEIADQINAEMRSVAVGIACRDDAVKSGAQEVAAYSEEERRQALDAILKRHLNLDDAQLAGLATHLPQVTPATKAFAYFEDDAKNFLEIKKQREKFRAEFIALLRRTKRPDESGYWLGAEQSLEDMLLDLQKTMSRSAATPVINTVAAQAESDDEITVEQLNAAPAAADQTTSNVVDPVIALPTHLRYKANGDNPLVQLTDLPVDLLNVFRDHMEQNQITGAAALLLYGYGGGAVLLPNFAQILSALHLGFLSFGIQPTLDLAAYLSHGHLGGAITAGFTYWKVPVVLNNFDTYMHDVVKALTEQPAQTVVAAGLVFGIGALLCDTIKPLGEELGKFRPYGELITGAKVGVAAFEIIQSPTDNLVAQLIKMVVRIPKFIVWDLLISPAVEAIRFGDSPLISYKKAFFNAVNAIRESGAIVAQIITNLQRRGIVDLLMSVPSIIFRGVIALPALILGTAGKIINKLGGDAYIDFCRNFNEKSTASQVGFVVFSILFPVAPIWAGAGKALQGLSVGLTLFKGLTTRFFGHVKRETMTDLSFNASASSPPTVILRAVTNTIAFVPLAVGNIFRVATNMPIKRLANNAKDNWQIVTDSNARSTQRVGAFFRSALSGIGCALISPVWALGCGLRKAGQLIQRAHLAASFVGKVFSHPFTKKDESSELETLAITAAEEQAAAPQALSPVMKNADIAAAARAEQANAEQADAQKRLVSNDKHLFETLFSLRAREAEKASGATATSSTAIGLFSKVGETAAERAAEAARIQREEEEKQRQAEREPLRQHLLAGTATGYGGRATI